MMSAGTRSGVNWIRAKLPPTTVARVSTASVLATPGTPSSRQWPRDSTATSIRSIIRSWPTITFLTSNRVRSSSDASSAGVVMTASASDGGGDWSDTTTPSAATGAPGQTPASHVRAEPGPAMRTYPVSSQAHSTDKGNPMIQKGDSTGSRLLAGFSVEHQPEVAVNRPNGHGVGVAGTVDGCLP